MGGGSTISTKFGITLPSRDNPKDRGGVVKWSACSPTSQLIRVRIPLKSTVVIPTVSPMLIYRESSSHWPTRVPRLLKRLLLSIVNGAASDGSSPTKTNSIVASFFSAPCCCFSQKVRPNLGRTFSSTFKQSICG